MISVAFVNGETEELLATSSFLSLQEMMIESEISIHDLVSDFKDKMSEYLVESAIEGEDEEKKLLLESKGDNVFKQIGEKVIALAKRISEFIQSCIERITNFTFKSKKDIEKVEMLCKEYPNLKDEIICSFEKGELNVASSRSLKELESTYEEILKLSKKADVKPGSLKDKWNRAVKKFENADKSPVFNIASNVATAMSLIIAFKSFKTNCMKIKNDVSGYKASANRINDDLAVTIEYLKQGDDKGDKYINERMGKAEVNYVAASYLAGQYSKAAGTSVKVLDKLSRALVSAASNLTPDKVKKQYHKDLARQAEHITDIRTN